MNILTIACLFSVAVLLSELLTYLAKEDINGSCALKVAASIMRTALFALALSFLYVLNENLNKTKEDVSALCTTKTEVDTLKTIIANQQMIIEKSNMAISIGCNIIGSFQLGEHVTPNDFVIYGLTIDDLYNYKKSINY